MRSQEQVEAFFRLRCSQCNALHVCLGDEADALIYRFLFKSLKFGDPVQKRCEQCAGQLLAASANYLTLTTVSGRA